MQRAAAFYGEAALKKNVKNRPLAPSPPRAASTTQAWLSANILEPSQPLAIALKSCYARHPFHSTIAPAQRRSMLTALPGALPDDLTPADLAAVRSAAARQALPETLTPSQVAALIAPEDAQATERATWRDVLCAGLHRETLQPASAVRRFDALYSSIQSRWSGDGTPFNPTVMLHGFVDPDVPFDIEKERRGAPEPDYNVLLHRDAVAAFLEPIAGELHNAVLFHSWLGRTPPDPVMTSATPARRRFAKELLDDVAVAYRQTRSWNKAYEFVAAANPGVTAAALKKARSDQSAVSRKTAEKKKKAPPRLVLVSNGH